jgi:tRNA(Ile)-lysidine synthase
VADQVKALEHKVLKRLKMRISANEKWLVAVSGGVDSLVLIELLRRWQKLLKAEFVVAHVHHGLGRSAKQNRYRASAQRVVQEYCSRHALKLLTNAPQKNALKSEAEWRAFRSELLENWRAEEGAVGVIFAHHLDDLLETRLLRLIRGTGRTGLRAMQIQSGKKFRPLLDLARKDIEFYAKARALKFVQDPSNSDADSLRNWLRLEWLPALERRQKGASRALSRSLEILLREPSPPREIDVNVGLRRDSLDEETLAEYLHQLGCDNYGRSHVQEILKRIDTRRKNLTFEMLGFVFKVTPDLLMASRV